MNKKILYSAVGVIIAAVAVYAAWLIFASSPAAPLAHCRNFDERTIQAGKHEIRVALADSDEERVRGLAQCREVPSGAGMLFTYESPQRAIFWMKDMIIPIDIVWIAGGSIVGIEKDVQPQPGASNAELIQYHSPVSVDAVLELRAGEAHRIGLQVGDGVQ